MSLPQAGSRQDVAGLLAQVTWTRDGPLHLYDSISYPGTVWSKKRDDCDGFAVLAAALLASWDQSTDPALLTVMLRPVKQSHTVCAFSTPDGFRYFDNSRLRDGTYASYGEVADAVSQRGQRMVCWDVVDPETLRVREFHRG